MQWSVSSVFILLFFSDKDVLTLTMTVVNVAPLKTPLAMLDQFNIEDKKKKRMKKIQYYTMNVTPTCEIAAT
jgi:hypothetical protein